MNGQKIIYKKVLPRHWTRSRNRKKKNNAVSFRKWSRKKFLSSHLSRQFNETKRSTKLVLVSREPLLYLKLYKSNKENVSEISSFKKFNFSQSQSNCWHSYWCQKWNIKTLLLKINWNKDITLLSDANVPVRFRAEQRAKFNSQQLKANSVHRS